ncbi:MAG: hypothetical protein HY874_09505 [Chloroflexi bacterium]|nr:hypothetical protein [Chloroflexota bacterium]
MGREPLANAPLIERTYVPDKPAMLAALRVVLGLPKQLPGWNGGTAT